MTGPWELKETHRADGLLVEIIEADGHVVISQMLDYDSPNYSRDRSTFNLVSGMPDQIQAMGRMCAELANVGITM